MLFTPPIASSSALARTAFSLVIGLTASTSMAQSWSELPAMPTARSEVFCAVLGSKVYVAGGIQFFKTTNRCEVFDTSTNAWGQCPDLPKPLHHIAMASVKNRVYASGGYVSLRFKPDKDSALWSLTPQTDRWTKVSALPTLLGEHSMVNHDQTLFLIGGRTDGTDSNQMYAFDTQTGQWTTLPPMRVARHSSAAVVANGQIWILGGRSSTHGSKMTTVEIYDIATRQWRSGPAMPIGRGGHSGVLSGGAIHLFGGEQFNPSRVLDRHDVLDLKSETWRTESVLTMPRHGTAACAVGDSALLIGGATQAGLFTIFSASNKVQALISR